LSPTGFLDTIPPTSSDLDDVGASSILPPKQEWARLPAADRSLFVLGLVSAEPATAGMGAGGSGPALALEPGQGRRQALVRDLGTAELFIG
jgi:hypothetical protein